MSPLRMELSKVSLFEQCLEKRLFFRPLVPAKRHYRNFDEAMGKNCRSKGRWLYFWH
jgi:hypothetical protein